MDKNINIQLLSTPLSIDDCYQFVIDEKCGGINLFVGTVREWNKNEQITHLDFEAYESMAMNELKKIGFAAKEKFGIKKIAIHHRTGIVKIKDIAVIIAVSSIHRKESFQACEYSIDMLKQNVPIWKKEYLLNGSHWVNSRP